MSLARGRNRDDDDTRSCRAAALPQLRGLLVLAAIIGVPISAVAYGFLALVAKLQQWVFTDLPKGLGFHGTPLWWPLPPLALAGLLVALTLRHLPGTGGHSPADGLQASGPPPGAADLPGVALAALATLSLGAVLGPEAPLIALGGGLGACAVRLARKDAPPQVITMVAAAGSFTAISTLFGSPLLGAFLLMEAAGISGATLELVLVPGLLASGIGSLIFIGLDNWTGLGTFSLSIPGLPHVGTLTGADFGWALVIGVAAALVGAGIKRLALALRPHVEYRILATVAGRPGRRRAGHRVRGGHRQAGDRCPVLRAGRARPADRPQRRRTRRARSCCSWSARALPTRCR